MSYQYSDAAMKVDGLTTAQKAVLLNYCIRADEHGYSYPGRQRIADDTSMSVRTVVYAKNWLIENGLIAPRSRRDPETGRQLTDVVRVNLAAMKLRERKKVDYRDNLLEEITFPEENAGQVQGADPAPSPLSDRPAGCSSCTPGVQLLHGGGCSSCTPGGAPGAPLESQQEAHYQSSSSAEDDEEQGSPLRGNGTRTREEAPEEDESVEVTSVDLLRAKALMGAIPWPSSKRMAMGATVRQRILARMAELSAGGWNEDDVAEYISGRVPDWKAVRRPAELVATLLADSPTKLREAFQTPPEPREEDELAEARRQHSHLAALLEQQKLMIEDCDVCDEMGWYVPVGGGTMDWHGHGKMGLNTERNRAGRRLAQLEEAQSTEEQQVWEFAKN